MDEDGEEGQDEATVRPCEISDASDRSGLIVRAEFTLADGTKMFGCLTTPLSDDDGLGELQPVIITERGQVLFWHGVIAPKAEELVKSYAVLGKDAANVFPVQFASDVELFDAPFRGSIPGFMVLEDWKTGKTKTVT